MNLIYLNLKNKATQLFNNQTIRTLVFCVVLAAAIVIGSAPSDHGGGFGPG